MDVTYDMPPGIVPEQTDDELQRRRQFMPPASVTPAQPQTPTPSPSAMPPANPTPQQRSQPLQPQAGMPPATQTALPGPGKAEMAAPQQNPSAMPPAQIGPAQQRFEDLNKQGPPQPKWWQRALQIAGSVAPFGLAVEKQIPGTPIGYNAALNKAGMAAAKEQSLGNAATAESRAAAGEARAAERAPIANRHEEAETREANARAADLEDGKKDAADKKIDEYVNEDGKRVLTFQGQDGKPYDVVGGAVQQKEQPDANKLAGEIAAQVGEKPTTPQYGGKAYPSIEAAQAAWGKAAEGIKNREAGAGRMIGYEALNQGKAVNVIRNGQIIGIHPTDMQPGDVLAGQSAGMQAMSKDAQFQEIHSGIDHLKDAVKNLDRPFSPEQIGKLTLAMRKSEDPTVMQNEIATILGSQELTPAQQDLVIWMGHLNERAMSLRNIAGMGQGSDQMRQAITAILPSVRSGSAQMMNKQIAAFEDQVNKLEKGVPKMPGSKEQPKPAAAAGADGISFTPLPK